jgi:intracellular sulfur oxidation DsrE/DsrF family protein
MSKAPLKLTAALLLDEVPMPLRALPNRADRRRLFVGALFAALSLAPSVALAETRPMPPLIADYGKTAPVENPGERPDPTVDYKVVMSVTKAGEDGAPPPQLDKAARLANLLALSGVGAAHRHIVVVLYGAATAAVLNEAGLKARGKTLNPSAKLIGELTQAGVSVRVCGQALAGAKIARSEVLPQVEVDLSALTTLSGLQLRGYALLPD